jgi:hypothetical protein
MIDAHQREQVAARVHLGGRVLLREQPQMSSEQSLGVVGPLDAPADPEQRFGDPAQAPAGF